MKKNYTAKNETHQQRHIKNIILTEKIAKNKKV